MKKRLLCAALATTAATLDGAILYNASIGCQQSCVTVSLSWAGEPFGVYWAAVDDSLGDVLFALTLGPSAGQTTGSIVPNPQTISGLSSDTIGIIVNGQAELSLDAVAPGLLGGSLGGADSAPFAPDIPEPSSQSLIAVGVMLLAWRAAASRRQALRTSFSRPTRCCVPDSAVKASRGRRLNRQDWYPAHQIEDD